MSENDGFRRKTIEYAQDDEPDLTISLRTSFRTKRNTTRTEEFEKSMDPLQLSSCNNLSATQHFSIHLGGNISEGKKHRLDVSSSHTKAHTWAHLLLQSLLVTSLSRSLSAEVWDLFSPNQIKKFEIRRLSFSLHYATHTQQQHKQVRTNTHALAVISNMTSNRLIDSEGEGALEFNKSSYFHHPRHCIVRLLLLSTRFKFEFKEIAPPPCRRPLALHRHSGKLLQFR